MRRFLNRVRRQKSTDLSNEDLERRRDGGRATGLTRSKTTAGQSSFKSHLSSCDEVPMIQDWQDPSFDTNRPLPSRPLFEFEEVNKALPAVPEDQPLINSPPFPLPTELLYLTIDNYLSQETATLLNLARAVPLLRHHCWTHAFHSVKIQIRQREIERKKQTSNVDLFLQLLSRIPDIYSYIAELDVQDRGQMVWHQQGLVSSSQEDLTTLSLLLVQTRRMTKLRSFRITTSLVWTNLPIHLKEAFFAMFTSSNTLSEIALSGILLPVNLLALIKNLQVVDFQTGGVSPPIHHPSVAFARAKQVGTMKIRDRNPFSNPMSVLGFTNHSFKPFSLPHLTHLEICLPGKHLAAVQEGLQLCQSLETFKVFVGTAGGLPYVLNLDCLPNLKSLTLAADITNILDSAIRFDWVINLLQSIPSKIHLEEVNLLIRTPSLEQGKQCEWGLLDELFHPLPPPKLEFPGVATDRKRDSDLLSNVHWPALKLFNIVWCTARSQDIQDNRNEDFVLHLPIFMPHLYGRGVMRMQTTYSDTHYNFWTYT